MLDPILIFQAWYKLCVQFAKSSPAAVALCATDDFAPIIACVLQNGPGQDLRRYDDVSFHLTKLTDEVQRITDRATQRTSESDLLLDATCAAISLLLNVAFPRHLTDSVVSSRPLLKDFGYSKGDQSSQGYGVNQPSGIYYDLSHGPDGQQLKMIDLTEKLSSSGNRTGADADTDLDVDSFLLEAARIEALRKLINIASIFATKPKFLNLLVDGFTPVCTSVKTFSQQVLSPFASASVHWLRHFVFQLILSVSLGLPLPSRNASHGRGMTTRPISSGTGSSGFLSDNSLAILLDLASNFSDLFFVIRQRAVLSIGSVICINRASSNISSHPSFDAEIDRYLMRELEKADTILPEPVSTATAVLSVFEFDTSSNAMSYGGSSMQHVSSDISSGSVRQNNTGLLPVSSSSVSPAAVTSVYAPGSVKSNMGAGSPSSTVAKSRAKNSYSYDSYSYDQGGFDELDSSLFDDEPKLDMYGNEISSISSSSTSKLQNAKNSNGSSTSSSGSSSGTVQSKNQTTIVLALGADNYGTGEQSTVVRAACRLVASLSLTPESSSQVAKVIAAKGRTLTAFHTLWRSGGLVLPDVLEIVLSRLSPSVDFHTTFSRAKSALPMLQADHDLNVGDVSDALIETFRLLHTMSSSSYHTKQYKTVQHALAANTVFSIASDGERSSFESLASQLTALLTTHLLCSDIQASTKKSTVTRYCFPSAAFSLAVMESISDTILNQESINRFYPLLSLVYPQLAGRDIHTIQIDDGLRSILGLASRLFFQTESSVSLQIGHGEHGDAVFSSLIKKRAAVCSVIKKITEEAAVSCLGLASTGRLSSLVPFELGGIVPGLGGDFSEQFHSEVCTQVELFDSSLVDISAADIDPRSIQAHSYATASVSGLARVSSSAITVLGELSLASLRSNAYLSTESTIGGTGTGTGTGTSGSLFNTIASISGSICLSILCASPSTGTIRVLERVLPSAGYRSWCDIIIPSMSRWVTLVKARFVKLDLSGTTTNTTNNNTNTNTNANSSNSSENTLISLDSKAEVDQEFVSELIRIILHAWQEYRHRFISVELTACTAPEPETVSNNGSASAVSPLGLDTDSRVAFARGLVLLMLQLLSLPRYIHVDHPEFTLFPSYISFLCTTFAYAGSGSWFHDAIYVDLLFSESIAEKYAVQNGALGGSNAGMTKSAQPTSQSSRLDARAAKSMMAHALPDDGVSDEAYMASVTVSTSSTSTMVNSRSTIYGTGSFVSGFPPHSLLVSIALSRSSLGFLSLLSCTQGLDEGTSSAEAYPSTIATVVPRHSALTQKSISRSRTASTGTGPSKYITGATSSEFFHPFRNAYLSPSEAFLQAFTSRPSLSVVHFLSLSDNFTGPSASIIARSIPSFADFFNVGRRWFALCVMLSQPSVSSFDRSYNQWSTISSSSNTTPLFFSPYAKDNYNSSSSATLRRLLSLFAPLSSIAKSSQDQRGQIEWSSIWDAPTENSVSYSSQVSNTLTTATRLDAELGNAVYGNTSRQHPSNYNRSASSPSSFPSPVSGFSSSSASTKASAFESFAKFASRFAPQLLKQWISVSSDVTVVKEITSVLDDKSVRANHVQHILTSPSSFAGLFLPLCPHSPSFDLDGDCNDGFIPGFDSTYGPHVQSQVQVPGIVALFALCFSLLERYGESESFGYESSIGSALAESLRCCIKAFSDPISIETIAKYNEMRTELVLRDNPDLLMTFPSAPRLAFRVAELAETSCPKDGYAAFTSMVLRRAAQQTIFSRLAQFSSPSLLRSSPLAEMIVKLSSPPVISTLDPCFSNSATRTNLSTFGFFWVALSDPSSDVLNASILSLSPADRAEDSRSHSNLNQSQAGDGDASNAFSGAYTSLLLALKDEEHGSTVSGSSQAQGGFSSSSAYEMYGIPTETMDAVSGQGLLVRKSIGIPPLVDALNGIRRVIRRGEALQLRKYLKNRTVPIRPNDNLIGFLIMESDVTNIHSKLSLQLVTPNNHTSTFSGNYGLFPQQVATNNNCNVGLCIDNIDKSYLSSEVFFGPTPGVRLFRAIALNFTKESRKRYKSVLQLDYGLVSNAANLLRELACRPIDFFSIMGTVNPTIQSRGISYGYNAVDNLNGVRSLPVLRISSTSGAPGHLSLPFYALYQEFIGISPYTVPCISIIAASAEQSVFSDPMERPSPILVRALDTIYSLLPRAAILTLLNAGSNELYVTRSLLPVFNGAVGSLFGPCTQLSPSDAAALGVAALSLPYFFTVAAQPTPEELASFFSRCAMVSKKIQSPASQNEHISALETSLASLFPLSFSVCKSFALPTSVVKLLVKYCPDTWAQAVLALKSEGAPRDKDSSSGFKSPSSMDNSSDNDTSSRLLDFEVDVQVSKPSKNFFGDCIKVSMNSANQLRGVSSASTAWGTFITGCSLSEMSFFSKMFDLVPGKMARNTKSIEAEAQSVDVSQSSHSQQPPFNGPSTTVEPEKPKRGLFKGLFSKNSSSSSATDSQSSRMLSSQNSQSSHVGVPESQFQYPQSQYQHYQQQTDYPYHSQSQYQQQHQPQSHAHAHAQYNYSSPQQQNNGYRPDSMSPSSQRGQAPSAPSVAMYPEASYYQPPDGSKSDGISPEPVNSPPPYSAEEYDAWLYNTAGKW